MNRRATRLGEPDLEGIDHADAAVAAGFARVFSGWGFFDNLAVIALVGHALGLLLVRQRQLPAALRALGRAAEPVQDTFSFSTCTSFSAVTATPKLCSHRPAGSMS